MGGIPMAFLAQTPVPDGRFVDPRGADRPLLAVPIFE
jgi:hypothetical protein